AYYQEAGRAGRDGEPAECYVLFDPGDARLHEWFIENDAPSLEELRDLYGYVRAEARRNGGRIMTTESHLATVLDWRGDGKARVGMRLLEQAALLEDLGENGGTGHWRLLEVTGRVDMQRPMRDIELRRVLRRRLLQTVMEYAQAHTCRRQYLLDYFGDPTPPVAEWCCDNCQRAAESQSSRRVASSPAEKAPLWVLDAVNNLSYGVGRVLLARILTGSRGGGMERYFEHPQYGMLRHMGQKEAQNLIDELIRERYLYIESGRYSTLALTPAGRQAVENRLALSVSSIRSQPVPSARSQPTKRALDKAAETLRLHREGLTPDAMAIEQGYTIGTIYNHLAELIRRGDVSVDDIVPAEQQRLIEEAVKEVGTFYLSPIKARLPEEIDYGHIRCVISAMEAAGKSLEIFSPPPEEKEIFERLMAWRREEARRVNQPPFFIFSNAALSAIAAAAPRDRAALETVRGVGQDKCDSYAEVLLEIVAGAVGEPAGS
ncbi:MAG: helix-turn-helix domain-containing protein, partial [Ardenticatenaceae bacterium]